jgi:hypothetical protein
VTVTVETIHVLIAFRFYVGLRAGYRDGSCLQLEWEPLRHSHHAVYGQVVLGILGQLFSPPCLGLALNTYTMQIGAILCAVTLGINIAYVMIERSLPKEARIVTGLQVARLAVSARRRRQTPYAVLERPLQVCCYQHQGDSRGIL